MDNGIAVMNYPTAYASDPVQVPIPDLRRRLVKDDFEIDQFVIPVENKEKRVDTASEVDSHSSIGEEEFRLPDGSPTFSAVMSELGASLSKTSVRDHVKIPVLPLATADLSSTPENGTPEGNSPAPGASPPTPKRRLGSPVRAGAFRARSYSWNYRNKMAAERQKSLSVSFQDSNSAHGSPATSRKPKKGKPRPASSHPTVLRPKYKILSENICVSHENIVREQERERHLAEGFSEVKSIFHSRHFDRLGLSPERRSK